jgi:hypothetical protein
MKKLLALFTLCLALTTAYAHPQDGNVLQKDISNPCRHSVVRNDNYYHPIINDTFPNGGRK